MMNSVSVEAKGRYFRKAADATTRGATVVAGALALNIATGDKIKYLDKLPSFQSWGMVLALGAVAVADKVDGIFARTAHAYGNLITRKNKNMDPFHDKVRYHAITAASALAIAQSNLYVGAAIGIIQTPLLVRDTKKTWDRKNAPEEVDTAATTFTKLKTGELNLAMMETASPLTMHPVGQLASVALHGFGAAAAMISGRVSGPEATIAPTVEQI